MSKRNQLNAKTAKQKSYDHGSSPLNENVHMHRHGTATGRKSPTAARNAKAVAREAYTQHSSSSQGSSSSGSSGSSSRRRRRSSSIYIIYFL